MATSFLFALILSSRTAYAAIGTTENFEGADWQYEHEASYIEKGWLQSTCITDKYIVCFQNQSNSKSTPDTLIAFYKSDKDENGNPVPKYSYAKHVTEADYEHGNGMTYNPNTHEIYISAGPLIYPENSGNIYVVDADSLTYKRTIKVGDGSINFEFITYRAETNQYILQSDEKSGFIFYIVDENFQIIDSITDAQRPEKHYLQDICVSGDYILGIAYNSKTKKDNYIMAYSISGKCFVGKYYLDLESYETKLEVESIAEVSPGRFVVTAGVNKPRRLRFYETKVPAIYRVTTEVTNGTITESTTQAPGDEDYTVKFEPENNYELTDLQVDGETVEFSADQTEYTFTGLNGNHSIEAIFGEIPKFKVTTQVTNGVITESKEIYRDREYKVQYTPDTHYELDKILIDGEPIDSTGFENGYEFVDITTDHTIEVIYKEIPSWPITTSVKHGQITETITKAYRDTNQTITYKADEDYRIFSVKIDGEKVDVEQYPAEYSFNNIQGEHTVEVVYYWKYLPAIIIACVILAAGITGFFIRLKYKRKKNRERRTKIMGEL